MEGVERMPPWVNMPALAPRFRCPGSTASSARSTRRRAGQPRVVGVPYGTDAGPLSGAGLPCVVFGPGDIAQAHTRNEWIDLREARAAAEVLYRFACDFENFGSVGPSLNE